MPAVFEIAVRGTDRVFQLGDGRRVTIGRLPLCEIHLEEQAVSRRHCQLEVRGQAFSDGARTRAHG